MRMASQAEERRQEQREANDAAAAAFFVDDDGNVVAQRRPPRGGWSGREEEAEDGQPLLGADAMAHSEEVSASRENRPREAENAEADVVSFFPPQVRNYARQPIPETGVESSSSRPLWSVSSSRDSHRHNSDSTHPSVFDAAAETSLARAAEELSGCVLFFSLTFPSGRRLVVQQVHERVVLSALVFPGALRFETRARWSPPIDFSCKETPLAIEDCSHIMKNRTCTHFPLVWGPPTVVWVWCPLCLVLSAKDQLTEGRVLKCFTRQTRGIRLLHHQSQIPHW